MKLIALSTLLALCALGMACGGGATAPNNATNASNAKPANAAPANTAPANTAPANAAPANATTSTSKTEIGVASCDEYLTKMDEYLANPKVPEAVRTAQKDAKEKFVTAWKAAASTPEGKAGLDAGCKAALDGLKNLPKF